MSDFIAIAERAMMDWWTANGEQENLEFRFHRATQQRIFDARPDPYFTVKGATRIVQFLGMPVLVDDRIDPNEIHIVDQTGRFLDKIVFK